MGRDDVGRGGWFGNEREMVVVDEASYFTA